MTSSLQRSIVFFLTFHQTFSWSNHAPTSSFMHRGSFRHAENNYPSHVKESTAPRQKWQWQRRRADIRAGSINLRISRIFTSTRDKTSTVASICIELSNCPFSRLLESHYNHWHRGMFSRHTSYL